MRTQPEPFAVVSNGRPMTYPTFGGNTVAVTAVESSRRVYDWSCTGGHDADHLYASLPFCRDDAKAHAETCGKSGGAR